MSDSPIINLSIKYRDVFCSRGNGVLGNPGNIFYAALIKQWKPIYQSAPSAKAKRSIAMEILDTIQQSKPPGRFLKPCNDDSEQWYEVKNQKEILKKIAQALREKPKIGKNRKSKRGTVESSDSASFLPPQEIEPIPRKIGNEDSDSTCQNFSNKHNDDKPIRNLGIKRRRATPVKAAPSTIDKVFNDACFDTKSSHCGPALVSNCTYDEEVDHSLASDDWNTFDIEIPPHRPQEDLSSYHTTYKSNDIGKSQQEAFLPPKADDSFLLFGGEDLLSD